MPHRTNCTTTERISGALEANGQQFPFYLKCRTVDLGLAGRVQFYYMPPSRLRGDDPDQVVSNLYSAIEYWSAVTAEVQGEQSRWARDTNLVLSAGYAPIRRDKGAQRVYRDAFLRPRSFKPEMLSLAIDDLDRIRAAAASQDCDAVLHEMDIALGSAQLSAEERLATSRAMDHWVTRGVMQFRSGRGDGLGAWLNEVSKWIKKYRKRSQGRMKTFLDVFATECKLAFNLCYSNFWIGILRWLEENRALDPMSRRFLSIWHFQNRPVETSHGRTREGIIYPTAGGRIIRNPDGSSGKQVCRVDWKTDQIGPEVIPDVFRGNVLALHPLSWILLSRNDLREQVGTCLSSPSFDQAMRAGRVDKFTEYWGMIEAIMTAAHLYKIAHLCSEAKRERGSTKEHQPFAEALTVDVATPESLLRDYIDSLRRHCPCGGLYRYAAEDIPVATCSVVWVPVMCEECDTGSSLKIKRQRLEAFLLKDDA